MGLMAAVVQYGDSRVAGVLNSSHDSDDRKLGHILGGLSGNISGQVQSYTNGRNKVDKLVQSKILGEKTFEPLTITENGQKRMRTEDDVIKAGNLQDVYAKGSDGRSVTITKRELAKAILNGEYSTYSNPLTTAAVAAGPAGVATGAAINAELEFDGIVKVKKQNWLTQTFKLNTYLFGDAGFITPLLVRLHQPLPNPLQLPLANALIAISRATPSKNAGRELRTTKLLLSLSLMEKKNQYLSGRKRRKHTLTNRLFLCLP